MTAKPTYPSPIPNGNSNSFYQATNVSVTNGSHSPTFESHELRVQKLSRQNTGESSIMRPFFGRSTSVAFEGRGTIHDFLQTLKNERFRYMPHDGSNWDKVLKWAENIGGVVLLSHGVLDEFMLNSADATRLICDSCISLIRMGSSHIKALLKVFSVFHKMAFAMSVFLRQKHLIKLTSDVRRELAHAYSVLAHLTLDVNDYSKIKAIRHGSVDLSDFDVSFGSSIESFYVHLEHVSTSMWTSQQHCAKFDIHAIRDFLSPQDSVVKNIMSNQLYADFHRAEFTCEWFGPHLKTFTKGNHGNNVFLVTGGAATGKTVLARWIYEKLQASIDDDRYDVLSFSVDTKVRYTTSSLTLIKSLLLQVLDRKIGHEHILSHIAQAMELSANGKTANQVEEALWAALEASFDYGKTMILIDGLDQLSGVRIGNPPQLEHLDRISKTRSNVKAIVLSRPVSDKASKHAQTTLVLESQEELAVDIRYYIEHFISSHHDFQYLKDNERHEVVQKILQGAHGSYLWAELQLQSIKHEKSGEAALKVCQTAPKTSEEFLDRIINALDMKRLETKHILSWVVAAERPLTLKEIRALLEVDLDGCAYRPLSGDVETIIQQSCGTLLVIRDGLIYFRHPTIRERLMSNPGKLVIDLKEAHRELTIRSMAYVKIHVYNDVDPQSDLADTNEITSQFNKYQLFEYATRYWILHFRSSSLCDKDGNFNLSTSFKICFSNAVRLALFEGSCLARQYIASDAEKLQNLAYNVRKTLFGEHSAAVLQSLILELRIGQKFKDTNVLGHYSFDAWKISRHVCGTAVVQALAEAFIEYTVSLQISKHTEFASRKEEVLQYLIGVLKTDHHEAKQTRYMRMLADLYIEINQVEKAVSIYREIYTLRLKVFGHLHEETHELYLLLISHLKTLSRHEEIMEITLEYHEYLEETLSITDERRIKSTMAIIQLYEERKELFKAEEILIRYWKAVSSEVVTTRVTELKIDFALKYSQFLLKYSRKEESEVILRGLWTEIQSYSYESRFESTMVKRIQTIASYFSQLEIFTMSRSIYQSLYEYYERTEQRTSTECITIVKTLAETITRSISQTTKTSSSSTTTTTKSIEESTTITKEEKSTLLEVFESSMSSTEISSTTISICKALCSTYIKEERYLEACEIYHRVISKVWESIEITSVSVEITEHQFSTEIFELAFSLAYCRFEALQIEVAETIYWNIFRSLISSHGLEHHYLLKKIKVVIEFFEKIYKYERVIEIYRELFVWMPICFGKTHRDTITILFAFARVCFRMRLYKEAATACYYIYSCFQIAHGCLHIDGWEAALLLVRIYEMEGKWESAYEVYGYIWRTFVRFGDSYEIDVKVVESIYSKYTFILQEKKMVEYALILQIAREYRETCKKFYGHRHELTIKATLEYAYICSRREEHHAESITLYNEVIQYCKETKTEFSSKTMHTCRTSLAKVYSSSTTTVTKAVELYKEEYEMKRRTERTSKETISTLRSLVTTYKKQSTAESTTVATQTLKSSVMEIFHEERHSEKLIESAKSMASIYKECGYTEQATTVIQEMRTKVIEEVRKSVTQSTKVDQKSYIFLASFQENISESRSFSHVMAELRSEIMMYESYFNATKTQTDFHSIIRSGSRLYFHLEKTQRKTEFVKIEQEMTQYFMKYLKFNRTVKESVLHFFFRLYLEECTKLSYENIVVERAIRTIYTYTKTAKFSEAHDLALLTDRYIHLQGGFRSEFYIRAGFDIAKYLVGIGTNRCGDEKLYGAMLELSRTVLLEALEGLEKIDMKLDELSDLLADIVRLLSEQKKYEDLERILQTIWRTRTIHANLPSSLVLWLGRCLIQTLACLNKFTSAIHLCHDIRYNLAHVRGPLDKSTLEFTVLLSELYVETKRYKDAMSLHSEVLTVLGEPYQSNSLSPQERLHIATTHTELLKKAYQRNGKLDKSPQHYYDIFTALDQRFGGEKGWAERKPQLEKWTPGVKEGDKEGMWKRPGKFEWRIESGEDGEAGLKGWEELVRKRSGNWAGFFERTHLENGNGTNGKVNGNGVQHVHAAKVGA
ncbi:hypothetical protein GQ43DRAFT_443154 [Delitschia confertaspora ATCC 74209]|uniref:AAA+ ATPase domain-containing protein n=1 Tax=Delitschia confertaspora ATCC 74209 TaxID=1513339 RepID=A0A9P4JFW7_9PLEO|nr:hypothetical protein GQ43DRAFT_443154 [Delitschia confertaspora ATCC 74209]